jgi:V8-like Glu-specific endopeptidase
MFRLLAIVALLSLGTAVTNPKPFTMDDVVDNPSIVGVNRDRNGLVSPITKDDFLKFENSNLTKTKSFNPDDSKVQIKSKIFGNDERTQLTENQYSIFPYRCVCIIFANYDTNNDGTPDVFTYGTGVLVGPNVVLSASHVVYSKTYQQWATLEICPGAYKDANNQIIKPHGSYPCIYASIGVNFVTDNTNDDWALLRLNSSVGNTVGYFSVSSSLNAFSSVRLYGYHSDYDCRMGYGPGIVTYLETYKFYHNCDAISGSSGGPITTGTTTVVGIHSGRADDNQDAACKVSTFIVGWVNDMNNEANS